MMDSRSRLRVVWRYVLVNWPLLALQMLPYLKEVQYTGRVVPWFVAAVWLTYSVIYLIPASVLAGGAAVLSATAPIQRLFGKLRLRADWLAWVTAVAAFSLSHVIIYADRFIFRLYGFHLNGFVWNLLSTRGGIESLGGETSTNLSFSLIIAAFVIAQIVLLILVVRVERLGRWLDSLLRPRNVVLSVCLVVLVSLAERFTYGMSSMRGHTPVLVAADAFPFYVPTTFRTLAKRWGYKLPNDQAAFKVGSGALRYPSRPIERRAVAKPLNIVWLVAESLRGSQLDHRIMPRSYAFSQQACRFDQHYSGGNGTRMAMFSMFYGLYGTYWFEFLKARRGPVLMDVLIDSNYQMKMFTSARFTYPEFDKTIFARLPRELLHEGEAQPKWRRDRENVDLLLKFIEQRDAARPFMTFMFFESTHANYYFTQDNIVTKPYGEDLNYATMDLAKDIGLIKARYDNASNHLDSQWDRIITCLREKQLLDSTIVLLTGDHGEEFMEKGHWGHARGYSEEQTIAPMVLWIPGQAARVVSRMTSHLDLAPTIMPLLGVTNPASDYSLGCDMLKDEAKDYTVLCDWNNLCIVDSQYKRTYPTSGYAWRGRSVTTKDDRAVPNPESLYEANQSRMVEIMAQLKTFSR